MSFSRKATAITASLAFAALLFAGPVSAQASQHSTWPKFVANAAGPNGSNTMALQNTNEAPTSRSSKATLTPGTAAGKGLAPKAANHLK